MAEVLADRRAEVARAEEGEASTVAANTRPTVRLSKQSVPRWAVIGIFLLLLIAAIGYARVFLMPVVLAFLLALVFSPVRRFMTAAACRRDSARC